MTEPQLQKNEAFENTQFDQCVTAGNESESLLRFVRSVSEIEKDFSPSCDAEEFSSNLLKLLNKRSFLPSPSALRYLDGEMPLCFKQAGFALSNQQADLFKILERVSRYRQYGIQTALDMTALRSSQEVSHHRSEKQRVGLLPLADLFSSALQNPQAEARTPLKMIFSIENEEIFECFQWLERQEPSLEAAFLIPPEFFESLADKGKWPLRVSSDSDVIEEVNSTDLWYHLEQLLLRRKGVSFIFDGPTDDHVYNFKNQEVLPGEFQSYGALDICQYFNSEGYLQEEKLHRDLNLIIRTLDNLFELSFYPDEEGEILSKKNRKLGLSLFGLRNVIEQLNPEGNVKASQNVLRRIYKSLSKSCFQISHDLAEKRGGDFYRPFENQMSRVRHEEFFAQISLPFWRQAFPSPEYLLTSDWKNMNLDLSFVEHSCWQNLVEVPCSFPLPRAIFENHPDVLMHFLQKAMKNGFQTFELR